MLRKEKRLFALKVLLPLIFSFSFSLSYAQCEGDSNLDDVVNIQDIILSINHILEVEFLVNLNFSNSDINNDQVIDVLDIVAIVSIVLSGNSQCELRLDLSLDWELVDDSTYFDYETLNDIINNEISQLSNIAGIIVIHRGKIVAEDYYNDSSVDELYNIWSVTKSFTSTLIGQAIDQGLIDNQNSTLDNFLPDYEQPYLQIITLHNLLSMTSGYYDSYTYPLWVQASTEELEWMPYVGPGQFWYNNSANHLNSHILYYGTGMTPHEFASINLFPYLGIENPQWYNGYNDINDGSASLELKLRDMVKLGQLYIQDGYSGDNQVISSSWIAEATTFKCLTGLAEWWPEGEFLEEYGYLWFLPEQGYLAYGWGGQFIAVIPEFELVIGTHSLEDLGMEEHVVSLLGLIYNSIVPVFTN